ncbi:MAG TPA: malto-oligosyltrehalose trehalohydrolase [Gemmatimonadaceae bacterium]|nr:malto-oligosyltrehalose trehalohydrolase [Gemmatimonadaceae bacterium]
MDRKNDVIPGWRRLPIGVELDPSGGAHARVWAPKRRSVELVTHDVKGAVTSASALHREADGYFSGHVADVVAGTLYRFRLDGKEAYPDPASRFQPEGPHGPARLVDPAGFAWTDASWGGIRIDGQVISEIHIGTFTPEGTFRAAIEKLDALAEVGITAVEILPLADFGGRFGWGYDGVNMYAPTRLYGEPDDVRAFVDAAHARGLGVILDVVYNHFGPDGNYLPQFSDWYMSRKATEWGDAINYDGDHCEPVREFAVENAGYWISEFHFDGLRLDATQNIYDESPRHLVADITARARAAAGVRSIVVIAENEPQDSRLVEDPQNGGCGVDAIWNDDFHHTAFVAMTGNNEAYLSGYRGRPQEFVSGAKYGFLYQGQYYPWQKNRRGSPALHLAPKRFVSFLESHDQVSNLARSMRMHQLASPGTCRALKGLLLLSPQTPMLFQGEEFGSTSPFPFFAGHSGDLAKAVLEGRTKFLEQFPGVAAGGRRTVLDPSDTETMRVSRLDWSERERHGASLALHRDLITLRKSDPVIAAQCGAATGDLDGAVLDDHAFVLRYFSRRHGDRLLVVNLGIRLKLAPATEPLLAPPTGARWITRWSSEDVEYGGYGTPPLDADDQGWVIPAQAAVLLVPEALG